MRIQQEMQLLRPVERASFVCITSDLGDINHYLLLCKNAGIEVIVIHNNTTCNTPTSSTLHHKVEFQGRQGGVLQPTPSLELPPECCYSWMDLIARSDSGRNNTSKPQKTVNRLVTNRLRRIRRGKGAISTKRTILASVESSIVPPPLHLQIMPQENVRKHSTGIPFADVIEKLAESLHVTENHIQYESTISFSSPRPRFSSVTSSPIEHCVEGGGFSLQLSDLDLRTPSQLPAQMSTFRGNSSSFSSPSTTLSRARRDPMIIAAEAFRVRASLFKAMSQLLKFSIITRISRKASLCISLASRVKKLRCCMSSFKDLVNNKNCRVRSSFTVKALNAFHCVPKGGQNTYTKMEEHNSDEVTNLHQPDVGRSFSPSSSSSLSFTLSSDTFSTCNILEPSSRNGSEIVSAVDSITRNRFAKL